MYGKAESLKLRVAYMVQEPLHVYLTYKHKRAQIYSFWDFQLNQLQSVTTTPFSLSY